MLQGRPHAVGDARGSRDHQSLDQQWAGCSVQGGTTDDIAFVPAELSRTDLAELGVCAFSVLGPRTASTKSSRSSLSCRDGNGSAAGRSPRLSSLASTAAGCQGWRMRGYGGTAGLAPRPRPVAEQTW